MFDDWKPILIVFAVLVALVVWGGWLPGAALVATVLLAAGAFAISANQLHPGWYVALVIVALVIFPGLIGLLAVLTLVGGIGFVLRGML